MPDASAILAHLRRIGRRYRWADAAWALSRHAWIAAAAAVAILVLARLTPLARDRWLALALAGLGLLGLLARQALRRITPLRTARRADLDLGLKDRLATALAFAERPPAPGITEPGITEPGITETEPHIIDAGLTETIGLDLIQRQRDDALAAVERSDIRAAIPIRADRPRLGLALLLGVVAFILALAPNPQHAILAQREAVEEAAKKVADEVEQRREALLAEQPLSAEEQRQLDAALAELRDALRSSRGRADQALADLARAEQKVRELRDPAAVRRAEAAARLGQQLQSLAARPQANQGNAPGTSGDDAAEGEPGGESGTSDEAKSEGTLADLAEALAEMSPEERAALAESLAAAAALASADVPEAAAALQDMASAARNANTAAAAAAAASAQAALTQAQQAAAGAQAVEGTMASLQQGRQAIASAGEGSPSAVARAGDRAGGQTGQAGGQNGQQGQSGSSQGQQGRGQGEGQGQGQGDGQGDGQGQGQGDGVSPGRGSGEGDGAGAGGGYSPSGSGNAGADARYGSSGAAPFYAPDGSQQEARQGQASTIYAPTERLGPSGRTEFVPGRAAGDAGRQALRESRNPGIAPPAMVPYEQVFSRYRDAAGMAIEREAIPPPLKEYVKQYFRQLEPE